MLVGAAAGMLLGVGLTLLVSARIRPDLVIALVLGMPSIAGLTLIFVSSRRLVTALGAALLALGPGWFATLALIEVVSRA